HEHHEHHEQSRHGHEHKDHNLSAAYFHVLADTLTSVLAILALFAGRYFGWLWMDALMGIVGAVIISKWALGLIKQTSTVLLDKTQAPASVAALKHIIEQDLDIKVEDLHLWTLSEGHNAAIVSLRSYSGHYHNKGEYYQKLVALHLPKVSHITIEMN
ncbi:cation diffusion facilitator family transporter, partial [Shewanella sp.]